MTQGIKVSKPTFDITSTEPRDYVLNSDYNTAVIYEEGERSVTINATSSLKDTYTFPSAFCPLSICRRQMRQG